MNISEHVHTNWMNSTMAYGLPLPLVALSFELAYLLAQLSNLQLQILNHVPSGGGIHQNGSSPVFTGGS
jgi:hypothetical protein